MSLYNNYLRKFAKFGDILNEINNNKKTEISEANRDIASLISLYLFDNLDKNIVIITPNTYQAQKVYDSLSSIVDNLYFYPKDDFISTELLTESFEFKIERISALKAIIFDTKKKVIITSLTTLLSKAQRKEAYISNILSLSKDQEIKPQDLIQKLVLSGYKRSYTIEKQGEVSLRGSIVDIFPINEDRAFRLDFFGNTIETIKVLDVESQRSKEEINEILIMPVEEVVFSETEKDTIRFYINDKLNEDLDKKVKEKFEDDLIYLDEKGEYSHLQKYLSIFVKDNYSIIDYIDNKIVCSFDYDSIKKQEYTINNEIYEYLSNFSGYFNKGSFLNNLSTYSFEKEVYLDEKKELYSLKEISLHSKDVIDYENRLDIFKTDLLTNYKEKTIIISLSNKTYPILIDFFNQNKISFFEPKQKIKENSINITLDLPYIPFDIDEINTLSITGDKIFKTQKVRRGAFRQSVETKRLKSVSELKFGDYVVHYDYGIGKFLEIKTLTLGKHTSDYIHLQYDKDDSVYVPIENLSVLSKYAGSESYVPKLSSLNSKEWEKTKTSARQKAHDLANRLMDLYSIREETVGFKYLEDDDTQKDFEADFEYELTKDQDDAIKAVKSDMENGKLMDRLVCGDVGFGKTEVALRAAFKAVLSGKQVAYLAPTTILARQHYHTFKERMDKYGVEVGLVSRFVQPRTIRSNLNKLSQGTLDVIIGTHRLLSKDVNFKNLGLLIIDEEQRFGVETKEKLKELKHNIDVLTLTATPIPRTLQMAITGIKDVSLIETAPKNRYPIQTYVLERNDYIVKDAIERELSKGGQVFYLYNRVEDIDSIIHYVQSLVPDARISCIHGKMDKDTIENTIEEFINKEIDILVSTTIIETGIDIPNVNTLIVHDADRYGLSQLYQIKGRVGRSDKISYAYLMYDKNKVLTEDAAKRLQAIKDFTELGSGFKIAVRDLSTRGAGEMLGREQSGFMNKVGVELYLKLLDEEVRKKKGEEVETKEEDVKVLMSRHIDKDYISDDYVKIEVHTKISKLSSTKELNSLKDELTDRFGPVSDNLLEYMYTKLTENILNTCNFERVDIFETRMVMIIGAKDSATIDAQSLFKYSLEISNNFTFYFKVRKIFLIYEQRGTKLEMYEDVSKLLEKAKSEFLI